MSANTETPIRMRILEVVKWIVVITLLVVAIIGNYYYRNWHLLLRVSTVMIICGVAGGVAMMTTIGKSIIIFMREARIEVRKVIWPTRQETFRTTLMVAAVTAIMSLTLWGLDSILVRVVSFIIELRL